MVFCPECGEKANDNTIFCGNCGTNLKNMKVSKPSNPSYSASNPSSNPPSYTSAPVSNTGSVEYTSQDNSYNSRYQTSSGYESNSSRYQTGRPNYQRKLPRTTQLNIVIILNWIGFVLTILAGLVITLVFQVFQVLILIVIFALIQFGIIKGLSNYNNTVRIIYLILTGISIFSGVIGLLNGVGSGILSLAISCFIFYTLAFHDETVALFKKDKY